MKISKLPVIFFAALLLCGTSLTAQLVQPDISNISLPNSDWSLQIGLEKFEVKKNNVSPDGAMRQTLATMPNQGYSVSVFIEKAQTPGNHIVCREYYWSKAKLSPLSKENLKQYEKDSIAIVEHDTKTFNGEEVNYHSINAYLAHQGYWIDIHISKTGYSPTDQEIFSEIINSIRIDSPKRRNLSELFMFSSQAYYSRNYTSAIHHYEAILETEKEVITIDKNIWYVVVDNLGMAYGISGDLNNCKRVFQYGIQLDPEYPMFYYNLACAYAEAGDIDTAILKLEMAFDKKNNVIKGESISNPRFDSSFKKYSTNTKFMEFLKKRKL